MYKPASTYRIQFNKDFNFKKLRGIIPYLKNLGIDTIYASPIFAAIPGSTHGYDTVNPLIVNPEIGTEEELLEISGLLNEASIGWLQDIVPNHMAFHPDNGWLMDVLKNGEKSPYVSYFDLDLEQGKLMVPFLDGSLEDAMSDNKIKVTKTKTDYFLNDGAAEWPINEQGLSLISGRKLTEINKNKDLLSRIIDRQHYRLCDWQETNSKINYRRFFTVNALICLNIQHKEVFDAYHRYIFELVRKGIFNGLRIDHIDGLYNPKKYLDQLKAELGEQVYVVVEKILAIDEKLEKNWNCAGTTGYDFLAMSNNLFTNIIAKKPFDKLYGKITGKEQNAKALITEKKRHILSKYMQGELDNLLSCFLKLDLAQGEEFEGDAMKDAIASMLISMPVYRYYDYDFPADENVVAVIKKLFELPIYGAQFPKEQRLLQEIFLKFTLKGDEVYNKNVSLFYQRCMQFSGPLMAKGVEDTLMFTFNRFTGHNEVGDAPEAFGLSVKEFHSKMAERNENCPLAMNASATHDTKKGEDVRARLNVLTDIPAKWTRFVEKITQIVQEEMIADFSGIHQNDLYFILQHIIGILPFAKEDDKDLELRLDAFIEKALREAKKRSDWATPDADYEQLLKDFITVCLDEKNRLGRKIRKWVNGIADAAILNSLSQLVLKFTTPGIPDVYQGTELWDLSLVDPDNRRAVDYKLRIKWLNSMAKPVDITSLWAERYNGKIKLHLSSVLFKLRKSHAALFNNGSYIPLKVSGRYADNIIAYARNFEDKWIIVALPLGLKGIKDSGSKVEWKNTRIHLPEHAPSGIVDLISEKPVYPDVLNKGILISQIFTELNIAVLEAVKNPGKRSAGLLMHISSLPSSYGIGDLGKEAYRFVDFLTKSKQQYWQILPLNPTKAENGHSPYSSNSAHAGNPLLISLESLADLGLLNIIELKSHIIPNDGRVDFSQVSQAKQSAIKQAYLKFIAIKELPLRKDFETFIVEEQSWLDNFALYTAIKAHHQHAEWYRWPQQFKFRDKKTLEKFQKENEKELLEIKWQQFIFYRQWESLKSYANQKHIKIIGDLPFYLDYDSVEVWSQPQYFKLNDDLSLDKVAGVPPDYFNEEGQLWGMPVFNWATLKADGFKWWIERLKWNLRCFDVVRLDHFLAFSAYWQVDAGSINATSGAWQKGPGATFFEKLQQELGKLPFIAEDLGERSSDSDALKLKFKLPGMSVLQFGFGEDLNGSVHIPFNIDSNSVVYSGTHDNNTVLGWFLEDASPTEKKRLKKFTGRKINWENVNDIILRMAYASSAKLVVLPVQDLLELDGHARMNVPGTSHGNWTWRLTEGQLNKKVQRKLELGVRLYGRLY